MKELSAQTGRHPARAAASWLVVMFTAALGACSDSQGPTPADLNAAYESALSATAAPVARIYVAGSADEAVALERLEAYFATMTPASVVADTGKIYSADGFLYDNIAAVQGVDDITRYFAKAAGEVDALSVEFLQVARSDEDYFIRWRMTIDSPALGEKGELVSYGVTQFRFDNEGRVLLHRDFWDAATGLYEFIPVLGGLVARTRSTLADFSDD